MLLFTHGSEKPVFFKKAQPTGFLGVLMGSEFLFERAVGKLVG